MQVLAFACVRCGFVPSVNMTTETYVRAVLPIGALFAGARLPGSQDTCMQDASRMHMAAPLYESSLSSGMMEVCWDNAQEWDCDGHAMQLNISCLCCMVCRARLFAGQDCQAASPKQGHARPGQARCGWATRRTST